MSANNPQTKTEKLKKKSVSGNGGKRPGAGRKRGKANKKTLERLKMLEAFKQRVMAHADELFNAQFNLAQGVTCMYRIDETGDGKNKKREHVLVTSPDEIKEVLDETDGAGGVVDETYYYITTKPPDNKAIDSLLDRTFGRATQVVAGEGEDNEILVKIVNAEKYTL